MNEAFTVAIVQTRMEEYLIRAWYERRKKMVFQKLDNSRLIMYNRNDEHFCCLVPNLHGSY
jgi:hypothetical protein